MQHCQQQELDKQGAAIRLDDLVKEVGVSPEQLDKRCTEEHLLQLSQSLTAWEITAAFLELDKATVEATERDGKYEADKRLRMLQTWKKKFAFKATYRKLAQALLDSGIAENAERVCHLATDEGDFCPEKGTGLFEEATSEYQLSEQENLEQQIDNLDKDFHDLEDKVVEAMEKDGVSLRKVQGWCTRLPGSLKCQHGTLLENKLSAVFRTSSINELFTLLSLWNCWNFLNCDLLDHVVHRFGNPEVMKSMEEYLEKLQKFRARAPLKHIIPRWMTSLPRDSFQVMELKMGTEWEDKTLADLESLRVKFLRMRHLPDYAMQFVGGERGCFALSFTVASSLTTGELVRSRVFFRSRHVLKVCLKGECILDLKPAQPARVEYDQPRHVEVQFEKRKAMQFEQDSHWPRVNTFDVRFMFRRAVIMLIHGLVYLLFHDFDEAIIREYHLMTSTFSPQEFFLSVVYLPLLISLIVILIWMIVEQLILCYTLVLWLMGISLWQLLIGLLVFLLFMMLKDAY